MPLVKGIAPSNFRTMKAGALVTSADSVFYE
jgi:hypothetical protein